VPAQGRPPDQRDGWRPGARGWPRSASISRLPAGRAAAAPGGSGDLHVTAGRRRQRGPPPRSPGPPGHQRPRALRPGPARQPGRRPGRMPGPPPVRTPADHRPPAGRPAPRRGRGGPPRHALPGRGPAPGRHPRRPGPAQVERPPPPGPPHPLCGRSVAHRGHRRPHPGNRPSQHLRHQRPRPAHPARGCPPPPRHHPGRRPRPRRRGRHQVRTGPAHPPRPDHRRRSLRHQLGPRRRTGSLAGWRAAACRPRPRHRAPVRRAGHGPSRPVCRRIRGQAAVEPAGPEAVVLVQHYRLLRPPDSRGHRQLRLIHLQPGASASLRRLLGRGRPQRRGHRGASGGLRSVRDRDLAGPLHPGRGRHQQRCRPRLHRNANPRRLPGSSGRRGLLRRQHHPRPASGPRPDRHDHA
jgi:hypothetical protein